MDAVFAVCLDGRRMWAHKCSYKDWKKEKRRYGWLSYEGKKRNVLKSPVIVQGRYAAG